jgi:hypothetical protein
VVRELQLLQMEDYNQKTLTKFTGEQNMRLITSATIIQKLLLLTIQLRRVMERNRKLMILLMLLLPFILFAIGAMSLFTTGERTFYYGAAKYIVFNLFE